MFRFSCIFLLSSLITACGSERDTAFHPSGSTSSSSAASIGASVTMEQIFEYDEQNPAQPVYIHTTNKQIVVLNTVDEFETYWDNYHSSSGPYSVDFDTEQVVLLDLGNIGNCTQAVTYRSFKANEYSNDATLVTFNYRGNSSSSSESSSSSSSSSSSCANPEAKRPFYFFKVTSRKKLLINEEINN